MSYRFPLQKVLDVKEKEKQQAQQELGVSLRKQMEVQEEIALLMGKRDRVQEQLQIGGQGVRAAQLHEIQRYMEFLQKMIEKQAAMLKRTQKEVEKKQHVLTEKSKDEKVWQEWKLHLQEEHRQEAVKQEQEMLDEMAMIRYFRQQRMR